MFVPTEENNLYALENQQRQQESSQQQRTAVPIQPFLAAPATGLNKLAQGTTYALVPTLSGTVSQQASSVKPKRKQVKNACVNCQKSCKKCDEGRPCQRCIRYGITETCKNSVRKERKRGVKRGPYKRRPQQKAQDDRASITSTSTSSVPSDITAMPVSNGQISRQTINPIPINFPVISSQILGTQVPTTVTTADGVGQFIIIPQNFEGILYYILVPVQQQNHISAISTCASSIVQGMQVKIESQSEKSRNLLLEEDLQKKHSASVTEEISRETTPNKEKEKDKSNLSVLSLVCSDLLDQDAVPYEQANKEEAGFHIQNEDIDSSKANTPKQNFSTPLSWSPASSEKNSVLDSVKNREEDLPKTRALTNTRDNRAAVDTSRVDNEDNPPSFETPSAGSPLLFSIPANSYPVAPAQYVPIKRESSTDDICNVKHAKHQTEEFQLTQHGSSFSQNQISMQQSYYGISHLITPPHSVTNPSSAYMAQNQTPPFYQLRYASPHFPQQVTPTSLSFAFNPRIPNINTSRSQIHGYESTSASPNCSDISSQSQKSYSNY